MSADRALHTLTTGSGERAWLDPDTGTNHFGVNPLKSDGVFDRGSCTVGILDDRGRDVASRFLNDVGLQMPGQGGCLIEPKMRGGFASAVTSHARRLSAVLGVDGIADVFFGPSGSDLTYWPLLFADSLWPGCPPAVHATCWEEIGTGSRLAAQARFHSAVNQFDRPIPKGERIGIAADVEVNPVAARDSAGEVIDAAEAIGSAIACRRNGQPLIVYLTLGSKTGLLDDVHAVVSAAAPSDEVLWVVDACQMRADPAAIAPLVEMGVMVMITGSKFFQAPPFCGALIVPTQLTGRLAYSVPTSAMPAASIFSRYDAARSVPRLRDRLPNLINVGLHARWAVALDAMERHRSLDPARCEAVVARWRRTIDEATASIEGLGLAPQPDRSVRSIVSLQVDGANREVLDLSALQSLHAQLVGVRHGGFDGFDRVSLGRPVGGPDHAFLRLAIGAHDVHRFVTGGGFESGNDLRLLEIVAAAGRQI